MYDIVLATASTDTMSNIMTQVGTFATEAWSQAGTVLSTITGSGYLMIGVSCMVVGFAVSLIGKVIRKS